MIAFSGLILLNVLDAYLTVRITRLGGVELNPVMRFLMEEFGEIEALIGAKVLSLGVLFSVYYHFDAEWVIWLAVGVYVVVCTWNAKVLIDS